MLPWAVVALMKSYVSLTRITDFLNAEELDFGAIGRSAENPANAVEIFDASFTWAQDDDKKKKGKEFIDNLVL